MTRIPLALAALAALALSGCATIFTGTHDDVYFDSEPAGAEIFIDGLYMGVPAVLGVSAGLALAYHMLWLQA